MRAFIFCGFVGSVLMGTAWYVLDSGMVEAAAVLGLVMVIFWLAAFGAYAEAQSRWATEVLRQRREALAITPESVLFDQANQMHPETVQMLLQHRKLVWRVKEAGRDELCRWVLDADPRIDVRFVEHVLRYSTQTTILPKNTFSDGVFTWDETKTTNDRDLYEAFFRLLRNRNMVTEYGANTPGQWIEPWNPETVAWHFGIDLDDEEVREVA